VKRHVSGGVEKEICNHQLDLPNSFMQEDILSIRELPRCPASFFCVERELGTSFKGKASLCSWMDPTRLA